MPIYKFNQKNKKTRHPAQRPRPAPRPLPVPSAAVALSKERILRPPNCFILFRKHVYPLLVQQCGGRQPEISKQCAEMWKNLSRDERRHWEIQADLAKQEHKAMYPDYVFRPRVKRAARVESTPPSSPSSASSSGSSAQASPSPITPPAYFGILDLNDPIPDGRSAFCSLPYPTPSPFDSTSLSLDAYNACQSVYSPVDAYNAYQSVYIPVQSASDEPLPSNAFDAYQHVAVQPDFSPKVSQPNASTSPSSDWTPYETSPFASSPFASNFDPTRPETVSSSSDTDDWFQQYIHQQDADMAASDLPLEDFSTFSPFPAISTPSSCGLFEDMSFAGLSLEAGSDVSMF